MEPLHPASRSRILIICGGDNASPVAAGGAILALVTDGELIVFEAGGAAFKVLRRHAVAETPTWAHLAVVGDGLLIKDAGSLAYLRF